MQSVQTLFSISKRTNVSINKIISKDQKLVCICTILLCIPKYLTNFMIQIHVHIPSIYSHIIRVVSHKELMQVMNLWCKIPDSFLFTSNGKHFIHIYLGRFSSTENFMVNLISMWCKLQVINHRIHIFYWNETNKLNWLVQFHLACSFLYYLIIIVKVNAIQQDKS